MSEVSLLRTKQVLERLNISRATLFRWVDKGIVPKPGKVSGSLVWRSEELEDFINQAGEKAA